MSNWIYPTKAGSPEHANGSDDVSLCGKCARQFGYHEHEQIKFAPNSRPCENCARRQVNQVSLEDTALVENVLGHVLGEGLPDNVVVYAEPDEEEQGPLPETISNLPEGELNSTIQEDNVFPTEDELAEFVKHAQFLIDVTGVGVNGVPNECKFTENTLVLAMLETIPLLRQLGGIPMWDAVLSLTHRDLHLLAHLIVKIAYAQGYVDGEKFR